MTRLILPEPRGQFPFSTASRMLLAMVVSKSSTTLLMITKACRQLLPCKRITPLDWRVGKPMHVVAKVMDDVHVRQVEFYVDGC